MKAIWATAGLVSLLLGAIGIVLPLLPTVPFVLLAAFCFARSSERLHDWLLAHRTFGPMIAEWRRAGAIRRGAKWAATVSVLAVFGASLALQLPVKFLVIQAVTLSCVLLFIWTRPEA
ncbi:MAG: YbaN family protein [Vannielia sp.]|uniref:YbaN family protein n=1 Tax=Vannielia sp. TaxID=2813045 RepID=UPI003B8EA02C